jgi:transcriptional regulator with XRE-family HTH domain
VDKPEQLMEEKRLQFAQAGLMRTAEQARGALMMTAEQLRAARAMLRLEQASLAEKAGVSVETIKRLEGQKGPLQAYVDTLSNIKAALEREGVEFVDGSKDSGPGVRVVLDRTAATIDRVTHHFSATIRGALEELIRRDPRFLAGGDEAVRTLIKVVTVATRGLPYVLNGQEVPRELQSQLSHIFGDWTHKALLDSITKISTRKK